MDFTSLSTEEKLERILRLLKFRKIDDTSVEKLLDFLSQEQNRCLVDFGRALTWINSLLEDYGKLEPDSKNCSSAVFSFALRLLTLICATDEHLQCLREGKTLERVALHARKLTELQTVGVKLASTKLWRHICTFPGGLEWFRQWKLWRSCLQFGDSRYSAKLLKEQAGLVVDTIARFEDEEAYDEVLKIVEAAIEPVVRKIWYDANLSCSMDNPEVMPKMVKFHQFMEYFFFAILDSKRKFVACYFIFLKFNYQNHVWESRDVSFDDHYTLLKLRNNIVADFCRLTAMEIPTSDTTAQPLSFTKFTLNFYNYIYFCSERYLPRHSIMVAELISVLWARISDRQPVESIQYTDMKFGDQVLMIQLMPILHVIKQHRNTEESDFLGTFMLKLFYISCNHTIRMLYAIQKVLMHTKLCVIDLACKSIKGLVMREAILSRERAILVFQALMYVLSEYLPGSLASTNHVIAHNKPQLLSTLLTAIHELVQNYSITWKECFETTTLVNICLALLHNPCVTGKLSMKVINLIQLSLEHFLSPNMVLLVENLEDSGLQNLGPCIMKGLDDPSWEIRDSTIQLVTSMVDISKEKFPVFQKYLLDQDVLPVIVHMAKHDGEVYVRAAALRCISSVVKVPKVRNALFPGETLTCKLLKIVTSEEEAIVRREAVLTFTDVFMYQGITEKTAHLTFSTLAHSAIEDLDWEVKLNSIRFWDLALEQNFQYHGFAQDAFPEMVFSKHSRKIVRMNSFEIHSRLVTIVSDFAFYGGLGVLVSAANDSSDLLVAERALEVIETLMHRLNKYNYVEQRLAETEVSEQDIDLTQGLEKINLQSPNPEALFKVSETEFLKLVQKEDLRGLLEKRRENLESLSSLDSLLEDILCSFELK